MDNIIFWNARGAGSDKFSSAIQDLVKMHKVDVLIICEPRVQFAKAKKLLLNLGFSDFEIMESEGFSGGIWMLWNKVRVDIDVIDSTFQSITVKVCGVGNQHWLLSGIYASPCNTSRSTLWPYLDNLRRQHALLWVLLGDFNELLSYADKIGGAPIRRFGGFQDWVCRSGVIDMGYQGADYTWATSWVKERLDRSFCTDEWRVLYPDACLVHLARMKSDHCPILLRLKPDSRHTRINTPFRFQAMWLQHHNFCNVVTDTWNGTTGNAIEKTKSPATTLSDCNRDVFGNIFRRKRRLLARICGIQKNLGRNNNPFLQNLERDLISQHDQIRDAEAIFWKQKSREKW
ncbi:uncharacterized protein LOC133716433 [Rosa rugosa]|uniref:uncharacterized protein LOC133716433 n=1 Tax=Rosa rugosa TaxID=74645 RepID=UPI002B40892D|nr:uncharacterized protein LOC133716433 [Rosa rugosa]